MHSKMHPQFSPETEMRKKYENMRIKNSGVHFGAQRGFASAASTEACANMLAGRCRNPFASFSKEQSGSPHVGRFLKSYGKIDLKAPPWVVVPRVPGSVPKSVPENGGVRGSVPRRVLGALWASAPESKKCPESVPRFHFLWGGSDLFCDKVCLDGVQDS